jgi:acyl carrier protein
MRSTTESEIKQIVAEFTNQHVTIDTVLNSDVGLTSLDRVEIIMQLEQHFDVFITDDEMDRYNTIHKLTKLIDLKLDR